MDIEKRLDEQMRETKELNERLSAFLQANSSGQNSTSNAQHPS
jgi:hypothetical protein